MTVYVEVKSSGRSPCHYTWIDDKSAYVRANLEIAVRRWCHERRPRDGVAIIIRRNNEKP